MADPQVPGLVISVGQGNKLETVLRAVGLAATFAGEIGGIISKGSSSYKIIASSYGDDVAKAICDYGDDIARIEQNYGKGIAGKTSKFFSDADDYILKHPLNIEAPRVKTSVIEGGAEAVTRPNQLHHFATDKNKTYTPQLEEIAKKNMS